MNEEEKVKKQSHKSLKAMLRTIWNYRIGDVVDVNMIVLIRIWKIYSYRLALKSILIGLFVMCKLQILSLCINKLLESHYNEDCNFQFINVGEWIMSVHLWVESYLLGNEVGHLACLMEGARVHWLSILNSLMVVSFVLV